MLLSGVPLPKRLQWGGLLHPQHTHLLSGGFRFETENSQCDTFFGLVSVPTRLVT